MSKSMPNIYRAVGLSIGLMALPLAASAQGETVTPFHGAQWVKTTIGTTIYVTYAEYVEIQGRIAQQQAAAQTASISASRHNADTVSMSPWLIGAFR